MAARHQPADWEARYHYKPVLHRPALLETFVEQGRFVGTAYKVANWMYIGQAKGREKLGPSGKQSISVKGLWLYPLKRDFGSVLTQ